MEISNARLIELVRELLTSIDDNCYEHSEKLNVIKGSGITADELKTLGFDYINTWLEDAGMDDWGEDDDDFEDNDFDPDGRRAEMPWDYGRHFDDDLDEEEEEIDRLYHDASEDELREMGCFDNLNDDAELDDDYVPSAENGDYSPSHPWDAPGMKISDFI